MRIAAALASSLAVHAGLVAAFVYPWRPSAADQPPAPGVIQIAGAAQEVDILPIEPVAAEAARERERGARPGPAPASAVGARRRPAPAAAPAVAVGSAERRESGTAARAARASARAAAEPPPVGGAPLVGPPGAHMTALLRLSRVRGTRYEAATGDLLAALAGERESTRGEPPSSAGRGPSREGSGTLPGFLSQLLEAAAIEPCRDFDDVVVATSDPFVPASSFLAVRHHLPESALRAALENEALRDHRPILFAAPDVFVVTPRAYRSFFVGASSGRRREPTPAPAMDGDRAGAAAAAVAAGDGAPAPSRRRDAGDSVESASWAALMNRIGGEEGLPGGTVFGVSLVDLFSAPAVWLLGLPAPRLVAIRGAIQPAAVVDVTLELASEDAARVWQDEWPRMRHRLFADGQTSASLLRRARVSRHASTVAIRIPLADDEMLTLLRAAAEGLRRRE